MKERKGWIRKDGHKYSVVIDDKGNTIPVSSVLFPTAISTMGATKLSWVIANYLMNGEFPFKVSEKIEDEVKRAIGDRG